MECVCSLVVVTQFDWETILLEFAAGRCSGSGDLVTGMGEISVVVEGGRTGGVVSSLMVNAIYSLCQDTLRSPIIINTIATSSCIGHRRLQISPFTFS